MKIQTERAKELDLYLSEQQEVGKWRIEIAGRPEMLSFYRFPINLLRYNSQNGRLAMEVREWEERNRSQLDPSNAKDAKVIRDLLLDLEQNETERLREDLEQKGQMEPGVLTYDGVVINGNRRMAVLEALHETQASKWDYLEAVRLPRNIGQRDLWKIEAGLQLSKDKVAEYHPVNELLKIKQGIDEGLTPMEVAAVMYGRTSEEVKDALNRLELIDNFLQFFGQPRNYGLIKKAGLHEYFIDIQKTVVGTWDRDGLPAKQRKAQLEYAFALLRAGILAQERTEKKRKSGITHWDVRKLGKIFADYEAKSTFLEHLEKAKGSYRDKGKKLLTVPPEIVIEDFRAAEDVLAMKEQRDQPVRLIEKATKALESIDRKDMHFREEPVKDAMKRLSAVIEGIEKDLAE